MGASNTRRKEARLKRKRSIRTKISGSADRPRLTVFRSAKHIYAQVVDDTSGKTLASASSSEAAAKEQSEIGNRKEMAQWVGKLVGERAKKKGIQKVVFDRNGFLYHGRVKALSDGARQAGLDF
ncbi:MAG: 50S ribosomal protein L18 [Desulfobacteraceae bacterium]|jgi:large subunit ribosomal protein L18|nr:MAG: 50S ribosomal protein L18 [Desulfobacteraceae bacterium]